MFVFSFRLFNLYLFLKIEHHILIAALVHTEGPEIRLSHSKVTLKTVSPNTPDEWIGITSYKYTVEVN